jgi:hypothetical protein
MRPVFSLLAVMLAVAGGVGEFAYQFKAHWTPLQRLYFSPYFQTAHLVRVRNPYLRRPRVVSMLAVTFPRGTRLGVDSDLISVPALPEQPPSAARFALSNVTRAAGAKRLEWRTLRVDDEWLHAWLAHSIYGDRSLWQLWRDAWYTSLLLLAALLPFAIRQDTEDARQRLLGRVLKGANLLTRSQFHRRTRHHTGVGWRTKGLPSLWELLSMRSRERSVVRVARQNECQHFLMVGDTGTGKSSLIRQLLYQIQDRGETAVVYDPAREYLPQFYNEARGDVVLNPLDSRMPYWGPADELLHPTEADAIAKSLFPDREHTNPFFIESPRKILAHLLKLHPTPQELCHWIAYADPEIDSRVAGTALEQIISKDAPPQRSGVLGVLERAAATFGLLPPPEGRRHWSATTWAQHRAGWVFLTSTTPTRETLKPLISLWLDFMILRLTSQTDFAPLPAWVIVDELASLENLPNLPLALAESRKSNTRIVLGLQGRSQVETRYGREAEAMLSQPRTKFFFRTGEPRAAEWVSKSIGDIEIEHLREGRTSGDFGLYYSKNASIESRIESAILASEITNLDDLQGYFQTPGFTLKLRYPFVPARNLQPAFIERPDLRTFPTGPRFDNTDSTTLEHDQTEPPDASGAIRHRIPTAERDPDDTKESRSMLQVQ